MKLMHYRQESVNTLTLEIDGKQYRIHGDAEITLREKSSIRDSIASANTIRELRENLRFFGRTLNEAK